MTGDLVERLRAGIMVAETERDAAVAALGDAKAEAERLQLCLGARNTESDLIWLEEVARVEAEVVAAKAEADRLRLCLEVSDSDRLQVIQHQLDAKAEAAALRDALQGLYDASAPMTFGLPTSQMVVWWRILIEARRAAGGPLKERPT